MKNIFAVFLYLVLLATSGQAFAGIYSSNNASLSEADFASGGAGQVSAKWDTGSCGSGTAATAGTPIAANDMFTICGGHTLTLGASLTFDGVAIDVATGGTLAIGTSTLTMNHSVPMLTNSGGTISMGSTVPGSAGGISFPNGGSLMHTGGTFTANTGSTVSFGGNSSITVVGTLTLSHLTTTAGTLQIPNEATIAGNLRIKGTVTAAGNGLKLTNANHGISTSATATINKLDTSLMAAGTLIQFNPYVSGASVAVTAFTPPTTPGTGVTLTCTPTGGGTGTASGTTTSPLTNQTGDYTCTNGAGGSGGSAVSAPIFSTKEKPAVFSEEVKH